MTDAALLRTPLYDLHLELQARMVPFAGYSMPVQYPTGLLTEHKHTRSAAGLFDVSHMGQIRVAGPQAAAALERLMPVDVRGLALHQQRYGLLLNAEGGILDDLMFVRREDGYYLIVNGACKQADLAHILSHIGTDCEVTHLTEQALLALQGPQAAAVLYRLLPELPPLVFMQGAASSWQGHAIYATRSGYTGEDGFEISLPANIATAFARRLLAQAELAPIGLGARNSLRLEAGLGLYGNDLDSSTTPVEASLAWAIQKVRRTGGARAGGFIGAERLLPQLDQPASISRKRVCLLGQERIPVREPSPLVDAEGSALGHITSGLLSPMLDQPIAMGYVPPAYAATGTEIFAMVRGKRVPMQVCAAPFVATRYYRG